MYTEALEQMSIMQSQGKTEETTDYVIDGVKFSIVDKLGSLVGGSASRSMRDDAGGSEAGYEIANSEGVRLMVMDTPGQEGDEEGLIDVEAIQAEMDQLDEGDDVGAAGEEGMEEGEEGAEEGEGSEVAEGAVTQRSARRVRRPKRD